MPKKSDAASGNALARIAEANEWLARACADLASKLADSAKTEASREVLPTVEKPQDAGPKDFRSTEYVTGRHTGDPVAGIIALTLVDGSARYALDNANYLARELGR